MDDHPSREVGRRREVVGHARDASAVTNELGRDHSVFLRVDEERVAMRERPRVLVNMSTKPKPASISDATIQMDHSAVVLFTIDRLARTPRTTVR